MGPEEDIHIVSELMDDVRDAVTDYQVSTILRLLPSPNIETTYLDGTAASHL